MRSTRTPAAVTASSIATRALWSRPALAPGANTRAATAGPVVLKVLLLPLSPGAGFPGPSRRLRRCLNIGRCRLGSGERGEEVAETRDPFEDIGGEERSCPAVPCAPFCTSSQVTGSKRSAGGSALSEYGAIVVLAAWFWLQSMSTLFGRRSRRMLERHLARVLGAP